MAGRAQRILRNLANQRRALEIIRTTGEYQYAYAALGVSEKSWERYFKEDPGFEQDCFLAKQYYAVQRQLDQYILKLQTKAAKKIDERIESGIVKDATLVAILQDRHYKKK